MNHYSLEDEFPETTESQLASIVAKKSTIAAVNQYADEAGASLWNRMNELWTQAGERGDVETQKQITAAYEVADGIKANLKLQNEALAAVLEAAEVLGKQALANEQQLDDVTEAIFDENIAHPLLKDFVKHIEMEAVDGLEVASYDRALTEARSEVWDEVSKAIKKLVPRAKWTTVYHFVTALNGDSPFNDIQRGLLISLLETFAADEAVAS